MAKRNLAYYYGLFAVLVVASVQLFFSLREGGYFEEQWFWGVAAILAALLGAALVPGYLSSPFVGRKQWALAGALLFLTVVVAASILWSISPGFSMLEASRTAMYSGAFVLLLPAAMWWRPLMVDTVVFGGLLPPAIYGLLQKILPASVEYTGFDTLETDPNLVSTIGYHPTFGMMCAMGALLVVARVGSFRSVPLRALYSVTGVLFLVALYFTFSRGGWLALAVGTIMLLLLSKHRFEVLGNLAITALPAIWVIFQAHDYPGLVVRPASLETIQAAGRSLIGPLLTGLIVAFALQVLFALLIRALEEFVPEAIRRGMKLGGTTIVVGIVAIGLFLGWNVFQQAGGFDEMSSRFMAMRDPLKATPTLTTPRDQTEHLASISFSGRIQQWEIAWENWREHPLTGTGGDTYQVIYEERAPEEWGIVHHPHSMWLSLLSDTGIFAFLAFATFSVGFLALACYNVFSGTKSLRSRALLAGSTAAATAYLVSSSVDWNWYIPASTLPFFALAAVVVGYGKPERQKCAT